MPGFLRAVLLTMGVMIAGLAPRAAFAVTTDDLYQSRTIVTGQGEENRRMGFKDCLDRVLVRVSGDQRLLEKPEMAALRDKAGDFVDTFRYHDRLEGIPIHDEQGTHDRPHDLTCLYKPTTVNKLLAQLGSKPWLGERPTLSILLAVERAGRGFVLASDGDESLYMRESFEAAAKPMAMSVIIPDKATLTKSGFTFDEVRAESPELLGGDARTLGGRPLLHGHISWSDKDLGWVVQWRLAIDGKIYSWRVRGVSFDEAFRAAIRGTAQILSGNGQPD
ncbi:DUF2066 domain-containing protein [Mesorhizobium intechi]|uniref:DUF2066 domain-containing protein n=1 Tax=Mesorhizobium intechi TaxID=537601 RepID=UPI000CAF508B|nr:DUF2066 domain-containing protein [Mesorhizobium intechi]TSE02466.1 DUF2066 domain-containing protein [Mesorhizobium intechi]